MGQHPKWEGGVMWREDLQVYPTCPKNLLWGCGCMDGGLNDVNKINCMDVGMRDGITLNFSIMFMVLPFSSIMYFLIIVGIKDISVFFPTITICQN